MNNPSDYSISVRRVVEGNVAMFEARIKEFPDVVEFADSANEAYALAIDTIETTIEIFAETGRILPPPSEPVDVEFSGRVTLRMPRSLHRVLAECADEEDSSFNQYLVSMLSYVSGAKHGRRTATQQWVPIDETPAHTQKNSRVVASRSPEPRSIGGSSKAPWGNLAPSMA